MIETPRSIVLEMGSAVEISSALLAQIEAEAAASPRVEICGLLLGSATRIVEARACRNVADAPSHRFEIDPAALIAAHREARAGGLPIAGCYHSHPGGSADPSPTDAAQADSSGWVWVILGTRTCAFRAVRAGRIHGWFDPLDLIRTG